MKTLKWRKPKETETQPKPSLQMSRYIRACRMYDKYSTIEKRANKNKKKWLKKVRYYQKIFNN